MDIAKAVPGLLSGHPAVDAVQLTGSRATGTARAFSDWDFEVETSDFARIAQDLPHVARVRGVAVPLFRERLERRFLEEKRDWSPPWEPTAENLSAIDRHFWDWILWLEQKRRGGKEDMLSASLEDMQELMLQPMGAKERPASVSEAIATYLERRAHLEREFGIDVPRELELEVRPALLA